MAQTYGPVPFRIEAAVLASLRGRAFASDDTVVFRILFRGVTAALVIMLVSIALGLPGALNENGRDLVITNFAAAYELTP